MCLVGQYEIRDVYPAANQFYKLYRLTCLFLVGDKGRFMTRMTLEGRSPLCVIGNKMCFASRFGNNICVHDNTKANNFKKLGDLQVGIKRKKKEMCIISRHIISVAHIKQC